MVVRKKRIILSLALIAGLLIAVAAMLISGVFYVSALQKTSNTDFSIEQISDDDAVFKNGYLDRYGVPTSSFTYKNNGEAEAGAPLSYAFDRNFSSIWRSAMQKKDGDDSTINNVEVAFSSPVLIDRILYQADSSWGNRGSFTKVRISYKTEGNDQYTSYEDLSYPQTFETNANIIKFTNAKRVTAFKIEWLEIHKGHRTCAAASEIVFLQPESTSVEEVQNLFTDYAQLELAEGVDKGKIGKLREEVKDYATFESELAGLLNRAEQILEGKIIRESRREMGTAKGSENLLLRVGDVAGYARSTLKMAWFGTNRQATGISVTPDDTLTVYVTGKEGDPLPRLVMTQFWGAWSGWRSGEYKLSLGKNVIHPGNYNKDGYVTQHESDSLRAGVQVPTGGPVYLVNPYEESQQSEEVKVYIEGGTLIPLFRKGGDVDRYRAELKEYADKVEQEWRSLTATDTNGDYLTGTPKIVDVTEIVSKNIIITVRASRADKAYNQGVNGVVYNPQKVTENWDEYVEELLRSDGVILEKEKNGEHGGKYDERATYLNCNIRLMQPFGAAYAHIEHVGIQVPWEMGALTGESFGWGYTHELGHMMDIGERTVSECSNNMLSKYDETVMSKIATRGDFAKTTAALAPDVRDTASYWNTNRGNFIFWWLIESLENGWWPTLENLYRYYDIYENHRDKDGKIEEGFSTVNATEKQVLLSSIAAGYDLSYYFERWGYNLSTSDPVFSAATASNSFKTLMQEAKKANKIKNAGYEPKIWYLDAAEWWARAEDEKVKTSIYGESDKPVLKAVTPCDEGFALLIDGGNKAKTSSHLGFEIVEGQGAKARVVGFSYEETYIDTTVYPSGYTPVYSVVAYDRALTHSAASNVLSSREDAPVCMIGQTPYYSLREAVAAAKDTDVIMLVGDFYAGGIKIEKPVTIATDKTHTISKNGNGALFLVGEGGALTLRGIEGAQIIIDGSGIEQSSGIIRVEKSGTLHMEYCTLQNSHILYKSAQNGAALSLGGGKAEISHCTFNNNSSRLGGAIFISSNTGYQIADSTFEENTAEEGGALYIANAPATLSNCTFKNNTSAIWGGALVGYSGCVIDIENTNFTNNSSPIGGAIYLDGTIRMTGGSIRQNTADEGAAIYYRRTVGGGRTLTINGDTMIEGNTSKTGSALYLNGTVEELSADLSQGDCVYTIYVPAGSVAFGGGKIGGTIFKGEEAVFTVKNELFTTNAGEKVTLVLDTDEAESVIFKAQGLTFADTDTDRLRTESGKVVVSEDKSEIRASLDTVSITFTIGSTTWSRDYIPGRTLLLNMTGAEDGTSALAVTQYIKEWKAGDKSYGFGTEYKISEETTFVANICDKTKITYHFENGETSDVTEYVIPEEAYTLPNIAIEQYTLNGWKYKKETFKPYTTRVAEEQEVTYTADTTKKFVVNYYLYSNDRTSYILLDTRYFAYGEQIYFVDHIPDNIDEETYFHDGMTRIGGYKTADGVEIDMRNFAVVSDMELEATLEADPVYVNYSILLNGRLYSYRNEEVKRSGSYVISMETVPYGYHITELELTVNWDDPISFNSIEEIEGYILEDLREVYFCIVSVTIEKNFYNVVYAHNGVEQKRDEKEYESVITLETPAEDTLGEGEHFVGFQVGREELVWDETKGEYVEQMVYIDLQLDEDGVTEYVVTDDIVINTLTFIEVAAEPEPDNPDDPTDPDPDTPDDPAKPEPSEGKGGNTGMIVGVAVAVAAVVIAGVAVAVVLVKKKKRNK